MATGYLSNYAENELLDHALKTGAFTVPAGLYIALSTADPTEDGSGIAEPVAMGYTRIQHDTFHAAADRIATNDGVVSYAEATGNWGAITHFAIFDDPTAGNMLIYGPLSDPKTINTGDDAYFADTAIAISWDVGAMGTYLANKLLDHLLKTATYTAETNLYVCLSTANPTDDDSGLAEPVLANYARVVCNTWDAASGGASENTNIIQFNISSGSWGTITHFALKNAATLGDLLFYGELTASKAVGSGDGPRFIAGALDIAVD